MCGIAGILTSRAESDDRLRQVAIKMSDAIKHRGPDGDGVWTDAQNGIAVSHRRLSIVDLSPTGSQPMLSSCGSLVMVYNGEIYNAAELRKELAPAGISFKGTSDTEVILEAFAKWGIRKTTEKLIGMFAMAVWNQQEQSLILIRDRLGIKPLYWSLQSGIFIFGSELKALRAHESCPTELNRNAIAGYLRNCYINNPHTIYSGVNQLQPGTILNWKKDQKEPVIEKYWSLKEVATMGCENPFTGSEAEATDHLESLLTDAVDRRMMADVPLGAFLSGGVDSSTVAALMQKCSATPIKTFSIGFNEKQYDESTYAAAVAQHLGTNHTELTVTAEDALEVIPQLPTLYDEPFSDPSQIPTYLVSKLTREHVTVALSGDGGDELFAGYERYFDARKANFLINQPPLLRNLEATILDNISTEVMEKLSIVLPKSISRRLLDGRHKRIAKILKEGTSAAVYRPFLSRLDEPADSLLTGSELTNKPWEEALDLDFGGDEYSLMQYIDTLDYLPDDILTKVDRASMAASLEARVPMLDHRIVEFSWTLPQRMKVRDKQGKWILRNVLYKHVPKHLIDRPKMGFGVPIGTWLKGPLNDWAEDLLSAEALQKTEIFRPDPVIEKWKQHKSGKANWEYHLWDVLNMQAWAISNK